tara:strand:+ start:1109 stop:1540 length:432 start_codon:yes stop_codon:yes gene_type:complete
MLEARETVIIASDNLLRLALKVENTCGEFCGRETRCLPHPAGELDVASAAEGTLQAVARPTGNPHMAAASRAAIMEHLAMGRADDLFGQSPVCAYVAIPPGVLVGIETAEADRYSSPLQKPCRQASRIPRCQGKTVEPPGVDP